MIPSSKFSPAQRLRHFRERIRIRNAPAAGKRVRFGVECESDMIFPAEEVVPGEIPVSGPWSAPACRPVM